MRYAAAAVLGSLALIGAGVKSHPAAADMPAAGKDIVVQKKDGSPLHIPIPAPTGKPVDVEGVNDLSALFLSVCLDAFPDDRAVAAKMDQEGYRTLTDEAAAEILKSDSGRGWGRHVKGALTTVTLATAPAKSCAVRTHLAKEPDIAMMTALSVGLWASQLTPAETLALTPVKTAEIEGAVEDSYGFDLLDPDRKPVETVAATITRYPGTEQVELRFVRTRAAAPR